jgi:Leucine-rich repeat (LRR) protein
MKRVSSEYYEFIYFDGGGRFPDSIVTEEKNAKHLFCKKSTEPKPDMNFLTQLPNLETIDARSCGISKINYNIPIIAGGESFHLERLDRADFSHNKIEGIEKFCFYSLQNGLTTLNLSNNIITKFAEEAFYNLKVLEILDLSNNNISSIILNSFKDLGQLKEFYFANNQLRVLHCELFSKSLHMQIMNFKSNQIERITCSRSVWQKMSTLDFSENKILQMNIDIKNKCFPNLKNLFFTSKPSLPNRPDNEPSNNTTQQSDSSTNEYSELAKKGKLTEIFLFSYITLITILILIIVFQLYRTQNQHNKNQHKSQSSTTNADQVEMNPIYARMDEI